MERHQAGLYLGAIALGAALGTFWPGLRSGAGVAVVPLLGLMLYTTFLGTPLARVGAGLRDGRFLVTVLVVNFALAPVVVFLVSRVVAFDQVLLVGVLFVLLAPCVDYVVVFTGLAGGARHRLLAATPLLMLVQLLLLPVYLWIMIGVEFAAVVEVRPFLNAFVFLILIPLLAAGLTQLGSRHTRGVRAFESVATASTVPLVIATLVVIVTSQVAQVLRNLGSLLLVVPVFLAFAAVMVATGIVAARIARVDVRGARAIAFSGTTRNSLVVLPMVLALPDSFALAPVVVVTQTLVELIIMVILVQLLPRWIPATTPR